MQEDSTEDAKAIKSSWDEMHQMVTNIHQQQDFSSAKGQPSKRPKTTTLSTEAQKGDVRWKSTLPRYAEWERVFLLEGKKVGRW